MIAASVNPPLTVTDFDNFSGVLETTVRIILAKCTTKEGLSLDFGLYTLSLFLFGKLLRHGTKVGMNIIFVDNTSA